jgi:hypothetical protein
MKTLLAIFTSLAVVLPQTSESGFSYTAHMEKFGKKSTFNVWASGPNAKFSVSESDDPSFPAGVSIIALNGGELLEVIFPEKQAVMELTRTQYRKLMRGQAEAHGINIENSRVEELAVDADGGLVAGIQTRYFKLKISGDATEDGQHIAVIANEEFWTAPALPNPAPSLDMLTQQLSEVDKIDALLDYKKLNGYPLKRVVELSENGQLIGKSLIEVTKISQGPVSESVFEIPPDYKKVVVPEDQAH